MESRTLVIVAFAVLSSCAIQHKNPHHPVKTDKASTTDTGLALTSLDQDGPVGPDQAENENTSEVANEIFQAVPDEDDEYSSHISTESTATQKEKLEALPGGFLNKKYTPSFKKWVRFFKVRQKDRFERFLINGEKYRAIIEEVFAEHGLPKDLFYVGLIESGYYLRARSRASAVGPWQFIRATGRRYGLRINRHIDERKDIYKSTRAAALYFKDLYNIFGSWELALSAYNSGEYGMIKRIRRANSRDFYTLSEKKVLPRETRNYVPKVLAAKYLSHYHQHYNIRRLSYPNPFSNTVKIPLKHSHKISFIAHQLDMSIKQIKHLNPELIGSYTPRPIKRRPYLLRIPNRVSQQKQSKVAFLETARSKVSQRVRYRTGPKLNKKRRVASKRRPSNRPSTQTYRVKRGDSLIKIARWSGVTVRQLKMHNNLRSSKIFPKQRIKIPARKVHYYTVRRGDNLHRIARNFGKSPRKLMAMNNLSNSKIYPGQTLLIIAR
jgi:membrane-bound lytic murein transglycosylase D